VKYFYNILFYVLGCFSAALIAVFLRPARNAPSILPTIQFGDDSFFWVMTDPDTKLEKKLIGVMHDKDGLFFAFPTDGDTFPVQGFYPNGSLRLLAESKRLNDGQFYALEEMVNAIAYDRTGSVIYEVRDGEKVAGN
jgi:hypothetical protein